MIKEILMRNCATFPESGAKISDCKKVNFLFGANGTGKTTISDFLNKENPDLYSDCKINYDDESDKNTKTIVYNKRFRERNLREGMPGVFILGEDNVEITEKITALRQRKDELTINKSKLENELSDAKNQQEKLRRKFDDNCWDEMLQKHREKFKEVFAGYMGSKRKLSDKVLEVHHQEAGHPQNDTESISSLKPRYDALNSDTLAVIPTIGLDMQTYVDKLRQIEDNGIWGRRVVGNKDVSISKLIGALDNAAWVKNGQAYLEKSGSHCPFCQQKINHAKLEGQLNEFFNDEYDTSLEEIRSLVDEYVSTLEELQTALAAITSNDALMSAGQMDPDAFSDTRKTLTIVASNAQKVMEEKRDDPGRIVTIPSVKKDLARIAVAIDSANESIEKYNSIIQDAENERKKLYRTIWRALVAEQSPMISLYVKQRVENNKKIKELNEQIDDNALELETLDGDIRKLESKTTNTKFAINRINSLLDQYGITGFKLEESPSSKDSYTIKRMDGSVASDTLSEGEATLITFLYFVQLIKGDTNVSEVSEKKIVVIDDPISSLDSAALSLVSAILQPIISNISNESNVEQIFILTHNVIFHKWLNYRPFKKELVAYWILKKRGNTTYIEEHNDKNPISTSYELEWKVVKDENQNPVCLANAMRRILETFARLIGYDHIKTMIESIDNSTIEDPLIARSLLVWMNEGSHAVSEDFFHCEQAPQEGFQRVFKQIFDEIGYIDHYNTMMGIGTEDAGLEKSLSQDNNKE